MARIHAIVTDHLKRMSAYEQADSMSEKESVWGGHHDNSAWVEKSLQEPQRLPRRGVEVLDHFEEQN
jgi:hypothetical protein